MVLFVVDGLGDSYYGGYGSSFVKNGGAAGSFCIITGDGKFAAVAFVHEITGKNTFGHCVELFYGVADAVKWGTDLGLFSNG